MADCPDAAHQARFFPYSHTKVIPGFGISAFGCYLDCTSATPACVILPAAIAFLGVSVLVTTSPFPRFIKLLLPFTFYLAFQYAVVARSYVWVPLLLFLCAYFWPERLQRPLPIVLCLGLLANVALHAAVISGGLAVVYLIDLWLGHREGTLGAPGQAHCRRRAAAGTLRSQHLGRVACEGCKWRGARHQTKPTADPADRNTAVAVTAALSSCRAQKQKLRSSGWPGK